MLIVFLESFSGSQHSDALIVEVSSEGHAVMLFPSVFLSVLWEFCEMEHPLLSYTCFFCPTDVPDDPGRVVEGDTIMFEDVMTGSSAVYQCNASNEYGYLLANAFVNVLCK